MKKKSIKSARKTEKTKKIDKRLYKLLNQSFYSLKVFTLSTMAALAIVLFLYLFQLLDIHEEKMQQRSEQIIAYQYWSQIVSKHPNYPDAYYNLALYSLRLNLIEKAYRYINHALQLDPNFKEAENLKKEIEESFL